MNKRILYGTNEGTLVIVIPTDAIPIEEVARKDVPQGVPYKIVDLVDIEDIISDRTFRNAWEPDFGVPDGYGDPTGWWAEKAQKEEEEKNVRRSRGDTN